MYGTWFTSQKWDSVRIWNTFQWNKNQKKSTIFNMFGALNLWKSCNKWTAKIFSFRKHFSIRLKFFRIFLHFGKSPFSKKIQRDNRKTDSLIIPIIIECDVEVCYKNIFKIRKFLFKTVKKNLKTYRKNWTRF